MAAQVVQVAGSKKNALRLMTFYDRFKQEYEGQLRFSKDIKVIANDLSQGRTQMIMDGKQTIGYVSFDGRGSGKIDYWTINTMYIIPSHRGQGIASRIRCELMSCSILKQPIVGTMVTLTRFFHLLPYWHQQGFKWYAPGTDTFDVHDDNSLMMLWYRNPYPNDNDIEEMPTILDLLTLGQVSDSLIDQ